MELGTVGNNEVDHSLRERRDVRRFGGVLAKDGATFKIFTCRATTVFEYPTLQVHTASSNVLYSTPFNAYSSAQQPRGKPGPS